MATKKEIEVEQHSSRTARPRAAQMRMPDEIPPKFGVQFHDDLQAQGVAGTNDVVALIAVFGLTDPGPISFPFQRHGRNDGKSFELRVEPSGSHSVAGSPTVGHQWIFRQTQPELTA